MDIKPIRRVLVVDRPANGPHVHDGHLYYAHHTGKAIWRDDHEVVLRLEDTPCRGHIASPDVHDDIMFFHGGMGGGKQRTFAKRVGIAPGDEPVAPFYLRAWQEGHRWFGVAKHRGCSLFTTRDPTQPWVMCSRLAFKIRHAFFHNDWLYYSKIGDQPERILRRRLVGQALNGPEQEVLRPKYDWEGADCPLYPSQKGVAWLPSNQLRDPMIHGNRLYYSVAGEQGIAYAEFPEGTL